MIQKSKIMRSSTPPQQRNSTKKIIIKSPSQEIIRFLNIPNPAVNADPRERLHIISPMNHRKSLSILKFNINNEQPVKETASNKGVSKVMAESPQINRNNRIGLIRKKAAATNNSKIQDGWLSKSAKLKIDQTDPNRNLFMMNLRRDNLLNFTFGHGNQVALYA